MPRERRRPIAVLGAVAVVLLAAGCRIRYDAPRTDDSPPEPMQLEGNYVHRGARIVFPPYAAGFERVDPLRYDREETDVSIGYRRTWLDRDALFRAEVTIYAFPPPKDVAGRDLARDRQFDEEIAAMRERRQDVHEIRRCESVVLRGVTNVNVRAAEFEFHEPAGFPGHQRMLTIVAGFEEGAWRVTYRVTVPPEKRDVTLAAVDDLLGALGLPVTGLPVPAPAD